MTEMYIILFDVLFHITRNVFVCFVKSGIKMVAVFVAEFYVLVERFYDFLFEE